MAFSDAFSNGSGWEGGLQEAFHPICLLYPIRNPFEIPPICTRYPFYNHLYRGDRWGLVGPGGNWWRVMGSGVCWWGLDPLHITAIYHPNPFYIHSMVGTGGDGCGVVGTGVDYIPYISPLYPLDIICKSHLYPLRIPCTSPL